MWFYFCAPQHHVEEPDDETVGQEDERGNEHRSMKNQSKPDMPDLERNQSRRRENASLAWADAAKCCVRFNGRHATEASVRT